MFEENRLKLGIFVIIGVSMLVGMLFLLGIKDAMKSSFYVYTYFTESVQGLEVGSAVKFKGVTVGTVSAISIHDDGKKIRVEMKTNPGSFQSQGENIDHEVAEKYFHKMIKNGLGCEQKMTGITGMKIIEIDYFKSDLAQIDKAVNAPAGESFLPAHRSALDNSLETVSSVIHKIGKIDFEKISKDLSEVIAGINTYVNNKEIPKIITSVEISTKNVERLIKNLNTKIEELDVKDISSNLNQTLTAYKKLAGSIDAEVKSIDLNKLSKEAKDSLSEVTATIVELKKSLAITLNKGNTAILEVQQILEVLNEDPSSVILGKQKKAVFKSE
ncbi:MAG: MCE family protein [Lentisphaeria bacterium]|nr:MCE family protein [Lentisphaeria bacterium]